MIEISWLNMGSTLEGRANAVLARSSSCGVQGAELSLQHQAFVMGLGFEEPSISQKVRWRLTLDEPHWLFCSNSSSTLK